MLKNLFFRGFFFAVIAIVPLQGASATLVHTAASFDVGYSLAKLNVISGKADNISNINARTFESNSGYEIDYNVALFDFRTIATLSFSQFLTSNMGTTPLTRIALGASYHFVRMNGERVILDNQVESKAWGISPALEFSFGLSSFSPADPLGVGSFTATLFDIHPRLLVEIPVNPTLLLMVRFGYLKSLALLSNTTYIISYSGYVFTLGIKLTTL